MTRTKQRILYKCVICLSCSDSPASHHGKPMVRCIADSPGSELSRPLLDADGRPLAHAPKWWIVATCDLERQAIQARRQSTSRR